MKIIELPVNSLEVNWVFDEARAEDLLVRLADGSKFLLIAVDEFDREIAKSRDNPRLMALIEARAAAHSTVSMDEVKRRINL
jgi:hypothetical protein